MLSKQSTEVMETTTLKVLGVVHLCTAKGDAHKVGRVVRWSRISLLFLTLVKDDLLFSYSIHKLSLMTHKFMKS